MKNRWLGPYRIRKIAEDRGTYLLDELDGTQLDGIFAGDCIKKFHSRYNVESAEDAEDAKDAKDDGGDGNEEDVDDAAVENIDDAEDTKDAGAEDDVEYKE